MAAPQDPVSAWARRGAPDVIDADGRAEPVRAEEARLETKQPTRAVSGATSPLEKPATAR
jgi:hypothetical protein